MSQHPEQRRHQAINNYLAADKVEDICRQLACSKSWLYKWRGRYDAQNPAWAQERSKRPKSHPTQTSESVERAVVSLHLTLVHNGTSGGVDCHHACAHAARDRARALPTNHLSYFTPPL